MKKLILPSFCLVFPMLGDLAAAEFQFLEKPDNDPLLRNGARRILAGMVAAMDDAVGRVLDEVRATSELAAGKERTRNENIWHISLSGHLLSAFPYFGQLTCNASRILPCSSSGWGNCIKTIFPSPW